MDGIVIGVVLVITLFVAFLIEKKPWGWKGYEISASWRERGLQGISAFWAQVPFLKIIYIFIAGIIGLYLIELFFNLLDSVAGIPTDEDITPSQVRNLVIAFLGTITGLGALFGVYLAIRRSEESKRQNDVAEQGLITDRISRATEGMGQINTKDEPVIEVRVGAIHSLERIAQDSPRDHIKIIEILCAYVRYNSPKDNGGKEQGHLREDLQTSITIIGRRDRWQDGKKYLKKEVKEKYRIDLCKCNLCRADFADANLSNASLIGANLRKASFISAELSYAWLDSANFEYAKLYRAYAHEADFSKCLNLTQRQLDVMFCGIGVIIPENLTRPEHWSTDEISWDKFYSLYNEWIKENPLLST